MDVKHIKKLQALEVELGELIVATTPNSKAEWDAFEKMVAGHKCLTKIDSDALRQMELPLEEKPKPLPAYWEDCPRCGGKGQFVDQADPLGNPRPCNCNEVEDIAWPNIKKEWEEQLTPVEG